MTTTESPAPARRLSSGIPRTWLLFIAIALLPFLMRLNLDLRQVELQTVQNLYRSWRWSPEANSLKGGTTVVYRKHDEKSSAEDLFMQQLQKDFKVVEVGNFPRVRGYFASGRHLRARVELNLDGRGTVWEGESRVPDNALLFGPWLGTMLVIMGRSPWVGLATSGALMLLWDSDWNPLEVPARVVNFGRSFAREFRERARRNDWVSSEMGRVPVLGVLIWLLPGLLALLKFFGNDHPVPVKRFLLFVGGSLLLEPVALWTSELFGKWDAGASWWKVYLGSFAYRFVLMALVTLLYFKPELLREDPTSGEATKATPKTPNPLWGLLLPVAFIVAGGWEWLSAIIGPGVGETLLRLRIFLVGWILAFVLGARLFSLWLGIFTLAIYLPPTTGHWNASALFGLLSDGLLLGWWVSPFKGTNPIVPLGGRKVLILAVIAWTVGVLLSSVGVPLGICWLGLVAAVWGASQLMDERRAVVVP